MDTYIILNRIARRLGSEREKPSLRSAPGRVGGGRVDFQNWGGQDGPETIEPRPIRVHVKTSADYSRNVSCPAGPKNSDDLLEDIVTG